MSNATSIATGGGIPRRAEQFCTFRLGRLLFGVEVLCVQEVLLEQPITPMPLASPVVRGLINLRGQIVTAIDMRRQLGMPPLEEHRVPMNVVVRSEESAFSLLVDEIGDVVDVDSDSFEDPPGTLTSSARDLIVGVFKLPETLLLALDIERAIDITRNVDNSTHKTSLENA